METAELQQKLKELSTEAAHLQEKVESLPDGRQYTRKIRELNEVKDLTQHLLGLQAARDGLGVKELHERYGLPI